MRIGIVGLGWAARKFNLPALRAIEGAQLVGGFDGAPDQRASWERETGVPVHDSLDALLERARPEVVVIATPPQSHADLCVQALEAGAHVICEKPFVMNLDEADRVLDAARAAGRQVAVNHEFRDKPIFRAVLERIGAPDAGRLVFAQIWQLMDLAPWDEPVPWRAAMPNRTLFEGGVHLVDLMLQVFGERTAGVYARHSSGLDAGRRADAIHLVTLDFPDGRLGQITIDRLCPAGTRYVELRADCERASLRASEGGRAVLQVGKKRAERTGARVDFGPGGLAWMEVGLKRTTLARNPRNPGADGTTRLYRRVAEALRAGEEVPVPGREARDVLSVIEA
ncbi:MAG: Gfo/Idh/MocA family protein, partial [Solirubrobacteraceae bacterium]